MAYTCFKLLQEGKVAHIQLCRPEKRNSMIPEFWEELPRLIREIDQSGQTRAIVISSEGPHFTAGMDLTTFAEMGNSLGAGESEVHQEASKGLGFIQYVDYLQHTFSVLEECRVPVLAAIQGGCIGGGVDMVTACDMRYATKDAYFTIYEIVIGMTADVGTFPRILNHLPEGIVRELAYTGRKMSAEEAKSLGLVNRIYDTQEEMISSVLEIAEDIAAKAPIAVHGAKQIITYARDHSTQDSLKQIGLWNASMLNQSEIMEAMMSKQMKKEGNFAPLPPVRNKKA